MEWDYAKFQANMEQDELKQYYSIMQDENMPQQMRADIYDMLFNGIAP
jgi:hypothetical protein